MSKRSPEREADVAGGEDDQPAAKQARQGSFHLFATSPSALSCEWPHLTALVAAVGPVLSPSNTACCNDFMPDACTKGDVDARAMEHLKTFPAKTAIEILDQFKNSDLSSVRNRSAYLSGVMGRYRKHDGDGGQPNDRGRDFSRDNYNQQRRSSQPLSRMVQRMLDDIYRQRGLAPGTLDQRCLDALASLSVNQAESALEQLETQDLSHIRSIPAWFMSIIKRINNGQELLRALPHRSVGHGGMGMSGGFGAQPPPPRAPPPRANDFGYGRTGPGGIIGFHSIFFKLLACSSDRGTKVAVTTA
eukprot:scaffold24794_cov36-Prasinocladus_malaysianus.AAC.1